MAADCGNQINPIMLTVLSVCFLAMRMSGKVTIPPFEIVFGHTENDPIACRFPGVAINCTRALSPLVFTSLDGARKG